MINWTKLGFCGVAAGFALLLVAGQPGTASAGETYRCDDGKSAGKQSARFIFVFEEGVNVRKASKRLRREYGLRDMQIMGGVNMMFAVVKGKAIRRIACDDDIKYIERDSVNQMIEPPPQPVTIDPVPQPQTGQYCPDEWIINGMPGTDDGGYSRGYFIAGGQRRELSEFDLPWVMSNCPRLQPNYVQ